MVGISGSGKTTVASALAARIGAPCIELDALHHLPGWRPIDPDELRARVDAITIGETWVIDGNYRAVTMDGPVWQRADTVVWLDLPRPVVMHQVMARTASRLVTRRRLWNGNREPVLGFLQPRPEDNIILWAWTHYATIVERYESAMLDERFGHLRFVRLRSRAEAADWLAAN